MDPDGAHSAVEAAGAAGTIDPHEIVRRLGLPGPFSASPLAENRGKGVWRLDGEAGAFALRVLRPDEHEAAGHEREAMAVARATGVPVPEVVASGTWDRRPVLLLSWCEGETLHDAIRTRPWTAYRLGLICGRSQARLNHQEPPTSLGSSSWLTRLGPVDPELLERLERVENPRPGLLHLDVHPGNVLVGGGDELRALLDWTNACAGDPRADLARTWSLLVARSGDGSVKSRAAAIVLRILAAGWQRGYEQVAGSQEDVLLFRIWALGGLVQIASSEGERFGSSPGSRSLHARLAELRRRAGLSPI